MSYTRAKTLKNGSVKHWAVYLGADGRYHEQGGFFSKKPVGLRLAAIEALRLAATPAALGTLQNLLNDSDRQVKAAAQAAAQEIKGRP